MMVFWDASKMPSFISKKGSPIGLAPGKAPGNPAADPYMWHSECIDPRDLHIRYLQSTPTEPRLRRRELIYAAVGWAIHSLHGYHLRAFFFFFG